MKWFRLIRTYLVLKKRKGKVPNLGDKLTKSAGCASASDTLNCYF